MPDIENIQTITSMISGQDTVSIFDEIYSDILTYDFTSESQFIIEMWSRYETMPKSKNLDISIFRALLLILLFRKNFLPIYTKARFYNLPNNSFDFVIYTEEFGPIVISAKINLRGRYKQSDLEGMMLRQFHRGAKSFLITLDEKEAKTVNNKIKNDLALGLDEVVVATAPEFDNLIKLLKSYTYIKPPKVDVLTSKRVIS